MKILTLEEEAANLRARFEGVNRAEFARTYALKGGQSMIYQNITGRRPISMEAALTYARGFGCSLEDISPRLALEASTAAKHLDKFHSPSSAFQDLIPVVLADTDDKNFYHIPKVKLQLRAGITGFQTVPEIFDGSTVSIPKNWVDRKGYRPDALIAVKVKGDSMEPNLYEDDIVIINTDDRKMVDGTVYAFNYEGEAVIKRLVRERGAWWLFSDNQDQSRYRPRGCTEGECIVVGRVVKRETERI